MPQAITIEYKLNPPAAPSGQSYNLPASKTHTFEIRGAENSEHYQSLREAIARARDELGEELTVWRDAVGKAELNKESKKASDEDEDEEVEDDV